MFPEPQYIEANGIRLATCQQGDGPVRGHGRSDVLARLEDFGIDYY